jgi:C4-dicarboxylate-specific signal transduction histidine kinase
MVDLASAKILDFNRQVTETYQYYREDLLGMSFFDLFDADDAKRLRKELRHLAKKDDYVFVPKLRAMKKHANHFFIDLHARVGKFQEEQHGLPGLSLIIRSVDITLALERQSQLIQASKMATLGAMATGIAHELNQPMSAMQVGGDFIAKMIRRGKKISDDQLLKVSRSISEQVDRAGNIINHLREFGRKSDFKVYPLDLNDPIGDVFTIMGQQLKLRNIEVSLKLDQGLPKILSDKNRLEQIFLNLVANARDAMEAKGPQEIKKLTVVTYRERDTVVAEISDTGQGMPEQIREKIFEPFFTTKEVGKGTGLGLSITYSLVRDFKGDIDVESTQGAGTTFRVRFPAHEVKGASE